MNKAHSENPSQTDGNKTSCLLALSLSLTVLLLTACASAPKPVPDVAEDDVPYQVTEDYSAGVISYVVQRGDRLSDIALEFTGDASNWRNIADYNNIANPRFLREGSELQIPTYLVPGYQAPNTTQAEPLSSTPLPQTSALAVRRESTTDVAPVVVTPINTNRNFDLTPIDEQSASTPQSFAGTGTQIKVTGTYYPKGIYQEPAAYSRIMMRAAPGTVFSLDTQVNQWYRIETPRGTGYIRVSDADIVN